MLRLVRLCPKQVGLKPRLNSVLWPVSAAGGLPRGRGTLMEFTWKDLQAQLVLLGKQLLTTVWLLLLARLIFSFFNHDLLRVI